MSGSIVVLRADRPQNSNLLLPDNPAVLREDAAIVCIDGRSEQSSLALSYNV
jgi:hypothetical protein